MLCHEKPLPTIHCSSKPLSVVDVATLSFEFEQNGVRTIINCHKCERISTAFAVKVWLPGLVQCDARVPLEVLGVCYDGNQ